MQKIMIRPPVSEAEEWKDIEGWDGDYQISNLGRVKSFKKTKSGQILANQNSRRYQEIELNDSGKRKTFRVHRLVASAFIDNPSNKPEVNHIDGNKGNNKAENLEWVTAEENNKHADRTGLQPRQGTPVLQKSLSGEPIRIFNSYSDAERATGVDGGNIRNVATRFIHQGGRPLQQAGGYLWEKF